MFLGDCLDKLQIVLVGLIEGIKLITVDVGNELRVAVVHKLHSKDWSEFGARPSGPANQRRLARSATEFAAETWI